MICWRSWRPQYEVGRSHECRQPQMNLGCSPILDSTESLKMLLRVLTASADCFHTASRALRTRRRDRTQALSPLPQFQPRHSETSLGPCIHIHLLNSPTSYPEKSVYDQGEVVCEVDDGCCDGRGKMWEDGRRRISTRLATSALALT